MATLTRVQPRIIGSDLNLPPNALFKGGSEHPEFVEGASATFDIGDLVYLTAGKLQICGVDGSSNLNTAIAGLAKSKATGVTDSAVHFEAIREDTLLLMHVYHGTVGSAVLARTQLGTVYPVRKVSGVWVVDLENTGEDATTKLGKVKVVSFVDVVGDTYGRVICKVVPLTLETDGGSWLRNLQLA